MAAEEESKELSRMQETLLEQAKEAAARTRHLEEELIAAQEGKQKRSQKWHLYAQPQHQIARKNIWAMWCTNMKQCVESWRRRRSRLAFYEREFGDS